MAESLIPLVDVLLPLAIPAPYSYRVPEGMSLGEGDYVAVPLGPRSYIGVVWERRDSHGTNLKLRDVGQRFEMTPMSAVHRKLIEWLSA